MYLIIAVPQFEEILNFIEIELHEFENIISFTRVI